MSEFGFNLDQGCSGVGTLFLARYPCIKATLVGNFSGGCYLCCVCPEAVFLEKRGRVADVIGGALLGRHSLLLQLCRQ